MPAEIEISGACPCGIASSSSAAISDSSTAPPLVSTPSTSIVVAGARHVMTPATKVPCPAYSWMSAGSDLLAHRPARRKPATGCRCPWPRRRTSRCRPRTPARPCPRSGPCSGPGPADPRSAGRARWRGTAFRSSSRRGCGRGWPVALLALGNSAWMLAPFAELSRSFEDLDRPGSPGGSSRVIDVEPWRPARPRPSPTPWYVSWRSPKKRSKRSRSSRRTRRCPGR